jgi:hypothetical protein
VSLLVALICVARRDLLSGKRRVEVSEFQTSCSPLPNPPTVHVGSVSVNVVFLLRVSDTVP